MLDGDVYVAEEDGTDPVRIVDGDADAKCGVRYGNRGLVSPDGRHIAYRSEWNDDCPGTVFIADLDGRLVASVPGAGWDIAWSPDGTRFATWLSWGESIGVYGIDGSLQAELDASSIDLWGDYDPKWTPDGTALLLPTQIETAGMNRSLVVRLPLDGGEPEILPVTDPLSIRSVSFSPDGTRAASVGPESQLVVATLDGTPGGSEFYFTPGDKVDGFWARPLLWSPNGDRIAVVTRRFSTDSNGDQVQQSASLWVVDPATLSSTMVESVSADADVDLQPVAFSPHGDRILVLKYDAARGPSLWTVASDGSGSTLIVEGADAGMWVPLVRAGDDSVRP
jgi:Tol biopolymer transport system component